MDPPAGERPAWGPQGWRPGGRIDEYRLLQKLGSGGMGVVFLAESLKTGERFAIKTIGAHVDPELAERFRREGRLQAAADGHPNVVRIRTSGSALGRDYLVMDYAGGGDLTRYLRRGPLPPDLAARVVLALARGLHHVHQCGILHRDLKPENVLFTRKGEPQLVDFGLARGTGEGNLTQTGQLLGTPAYMPPEQAEGRRDLDERADVYALGAILFTMLCGRPPFRGGSTINMLSQVLTKAPPRPRSIVSTIPPDLEEICLKTLSKDRELRPASAEALAEELASYLGPSSATSVVEMPSFESSPSLMAPAILGAVLVAASGLGLLLAFRPPPVDDEPPKSDPVAVASDVEPNAAPPPEPEPPTPARPVPARSPTIASYDPARVLEGPGWALAHGLTRSQLDASCQQLAQRKLVPTSLTVNAEDEVARFSVVWSSSEHPFVLRSALSERALDPIRKRMAHRQHYPIVSTPYLGPRGKLLHAEVYLGDGARRALRRRATGADVLSAIRRHPTYRLERLTGLPDDDTPLCAIFEPRGERPSVGFTYALAPDRFARTLRTFPTTLRSAARYGSRAAPLYTTAFSKDGLENLIFQQQSARAHTTLCLRLSEDGFRPLFVFGEGSGKELSFTSSWVRDPSSREWHATGYQPELARVEAELRAFLEGSGVTRGALAVTHGGRMVLSQSYTWAPTATWQTRTETRFRLGGLSGLLTTLAALRLIESGRLRLDQTVGELLSEFAARSAQLSGDERAASVTVEQLLRHTSGWRLTTGELLPPDDQLGSTGDAELDNRLRSSLRPRRAADLVRLLARHCLDADPGTIEHATDVNLLLLGEIVQVAAQQPYPDAVRELVLDPVGAHGFALAHSPIHQRLPGEASYDGQLRCQSRVHGGVVPAHYGAMNLRAGPAAWGWVASAPDLARVLVAISDPAGGALLGAESLRRLWTVPEGRTLGLAVFAQGSPEDPRVWLTATHPGSASHVERLPGGVTVALLLNADVDPNPLVLRLRQVLAEIDRWPEGDLFR